VNLAKAARLPLKLDRHRNIKAIIVKKIEARQAIAISDFDEAQLMEGDVTVRLTHSSMN
jgi:NADPH:quinone reductase-like Zn-dependent oxidoreductase